MRTFWMKVIVGKVERIWGCDAVTSEEAAAKCKAFWGYNPIWSSITSKHNAGYIPSGI